MVGREPLLLVVQESTADLGNTADFEGTAVDLDMVGLVGRKIILALNHLPRTYKFRKFLVNLVHNVDFNPY